MKVFAYPDVLKFGALRNAGAQFKRDLVEAQTEMVTGRLSNRNTIRNLSGRLGDAHLVRRDLQQIEQRSTSISLGLNRASLIQRSLDQIRDSVGSIPEDMRSALGRGDERALESQRISARSSLDSVIAALNIQQGRRFLFSGDAVDRAAVGGSEDVIAGVRAALSGAATAADANAALDAYFGAGGGFETTIYKGGGGQASGVEIAPGDDVRVELRADDDAFRNLIRGLAIGAIADETGLSGAERRMFLEDAARDMANGVEDVAFLTAENGLKEQRLENARARMVAEEAVFSNSYFEMAGADQYEAATRAQSLEAQLQTTYTLTARLSNLNFVNFIN